MRTREEIEEDLNKAIEEGDTVKMQKVISEVSLEMLDALRSIEKTLKGLQHYKL